MTTDSSREARTKVQLVNIGQSADFTRYTARQHIMRLFGLCTRRQTTKQLDTVQVVMRKKARIKRLSLPRTKRVNPVKCPSSLGMLPPKKLLPSNESKAISTVMV